MLYRLRDLPAMLATPVGRLQVLGSIRHRLWPLAWRVAWMHRRTTARHARIVVVVGSLGKSTTARAVASALGVATDDNLLLNALTSVASALLRIRRSQRRAVIEVGINLRGQMERYARMIGPDIVVATSVGGEHEIEIGAFQDIRNEKSRMVRALPPSSVAVLNGDDPNVMWMAGQTGARIVTYGFGASCDVRASDLRLDWPHGSRVRVVAFGDEREVAVRLIGRHLIYPVLAAIAVAHVEGLDLDATLASLQSLSPTPGRMQPIALASGVVLLMDEFKSSLETIHAALDLFAEVPARRRLVLLGNVTDPPCDKDAVYRDLGARAARIAAHLVVVGHSFASCSAGARAAGMPENAVHDGGTTPQHAAQILRPLLQPGDVVLIKGHRAQMLERVRLLLEGRHVGCDVAFCDLRGVRCTECPMLASGWGARRMVIRRGVRP